MWDRTLLTQVAKQRRKLISSRLRTWKTAPSSSLKRVSMIEGVLVLEHMPSSIMFMPHRLANIISTRVVKSPPSDRSAAMSVFFFALSRNAASSLAAYITGHPMLKRGTVKVRNSLFEQWLQASKQGRVIVSYDKPRGLISELTMVRHDYARVM